MRRVPWLLCSLWFLRLVTGQIDRLDSPSSNVLRFGWEYGNIARSLATHQAFSDAMAPGSGPTAWMPPLLCWLYALVFKLFGVGSMESALVLITLKSLVLSLGMALFLVLARSRWGTRGWVLAALITVVWPELDRHRVFEELDDTWLVNGLALATLWCLLRLAEQPGRRYLPAYVLSVLLPLASPSLALAYSVCLVAIGRRFGGRVFAHCLLLVALPCAGWGARNLLTMGHFYPVKSNLAYDFVAANRWDDDGILTDSFFIAMHPINPNEVQEEYVELGETVFLDRMRQSAGDVSLQEWLQRSARRFLNAFVWLQPSFDFENATGLSWPDQVVLRRSNWLRVWHSRPYWLFCRQTGQAELQRLPLAHPEQVLTSRRNAVRTYRQKQGGWREWSWSVWFSLVPALALLWLAARARDEALLAVLLYATFLCPYVLIQHYGRYQLSVVWIQAYLILRATLGQRDQFTSSQLLV